MEENRYKSNLKQLRMDRGLTIDELSQGTGIASRTIKAIEKEEGSNPQLATIKRLMGYLKISFEELFPHEY